MNKIEIFERAHEELKGTRQRYRPGFEGDDNWLKLVIMTTLDLVQSEEKRIMDEAIVKIKALMATPEFAERFPEAVFDDDV